LQTRLFEEAAEGLFEAFEIGASANGLCEGTAGAPFFGKDAEVEFGAADVPCQ
jgi:hypothetical protein